MELALTVCLVGGDCYEQRSRRLYAGMEECEEAGRRVSVHPDLVEEGFRVVGYTCRVLSD